MLTAAGAVHAAARDREVGLRRGGQRVVVAGLRAARHGDPWFNKRIRARVGGRADADPIGELPETQVDHVGRAAVGVADLDVLVDARVDVERGERLRPGVSDLSAS